ncbi:MAG: class I SAM-dependent methyltransferase [Phycisphaerae bacterium]|nr:class I SAM-dependent methyltransferase [Phycisphaerae bacterium]
MFDRMDLRGLLSVAGIYSSFQSFVGGNVHQRFVTEFLQPRPGDRLLDMGCGPADILAFIPDDVAYVGFDFSQDYIVSARRHFGGRGEFHCQRVSASNVDQFGAFDLVIALGMVHHLDDDEAVQLFDLAAAALGPGGRLVTFDGCYVDHQTRFARCMLDADRGKFVRWQSQYESLARQAFDDVDVKVRHDLLRIPYTHIIMECGSPGQSTAKTPPAAEAA